MNEFEKHVSRAFDDELTTLRSHVLEMGGLVEAQCLAATQAYTSGEISTVSDIVETDRKIDVFQTLIEDECAQVIAKRQPAATDLRLILGVTKIVTDLERIGDEAKRIAKGARRIHGEGPKSLPPHTADVRHIAKAAADMVRRSLDTFSRLDTEEARQIIRSDAEVDTEFKAVIRQLVTYMMEDPRTITTSIDIISIARAIERIGDHAKNIAEHIIYIVEGRNNPPAFKESAS
ncbi:phosphate transport system protein [Formivibrio citricus]|uniref:Phosphate-specific transport system accessory protein PhoU n=1 Tax=Formivibrio citricus TaxID=83765 RepID=A0A1I4VWK3_9NEIS|nr:phosphate signaling complex protein PhoU [Formivibrio citricus]SFN05396.1 phosphate transport system protein [Formivibrio citricus]